MSAAVSWLNYWNINRINPNEVKRRRPNRPDFNFRKLKKRTLIMMNINDFSFMDQNRKICEITNNYHSVRSNGVLVWVLSIQRQQLFEAVQIDIRLEFPFLINWTTSDVAYIPNYKIIFSKNFEYKRERKCAHTHTQRVSKEWIFTIKAEKTGST